MSLIQFVFISLRSRRFIVMLAVLALLLALAVLLLLEKSIAALENHFQKTVGAVHLFVGERGSAIDLLLQGFLFQGGGQHGISEKSYRYWSRDRRVAESASFSLGDNYRGHTVVAVDPIYFTHMAPQAPLKPLIGELPQSKRDVLLGFQSARSLQLKLQDSLYLTHGSGGSKALAEHNQHEEIKFTVCGILPSTGTALDKVLFIRPEAFAMLHHQQNRLNGFYLRLHNPQDILTLKWEILQFAQEPLMAILPSMTLAFLRRQVATAEAVLQGISLTLFLSSLLTLGIFMTVLLRERLREMAILRALGASRLKIALLILLESWFIYLLAAIGAVLAVNLGTLFFAEKIFESTGFPILPVGFSLRELLVLITGWLCVTLAAVIPVGVLYRRSLGRGLQG